MAPGRYSRFPCSRPSGRAARTHSPARSCSSVAWLCAIARLMDALTVTAVAAEGAAAAEFEISELFDDIGAAASEDIDDAPAPAAADDENKEDKDDA